MLLLLVQRLKTIMQQLTLRMLVPKMLLLVLRKHVCCYNCPIDHLHVLTHYCLVYDADNDHQSHIQEPGVA